MKTNVRPSDLDRDLTNDARLLALCEALLAAEEKYDRCGGAKVLRAVCVLRERVMDRARGYRGRTYHHWACTCENCKAGSLLDRHGVEYATTESSTYCRHGRYVGTPGGADYICGLCEDGVGVCEMCGELGNQYGRKEEGVRSIAWVDWAGKDLCRDCRRAESRTLGKRFRHFEEGVEFYQNPAMSLFYKRVQGQGYWHLAVR